MSILITCKRGDGTKEVPSINESLIVTESMAKARCKRFLDDPAQGAYYLTKRRGLKVPHKGSTIIPTAWITVTDSHLGLSSTKLKIKNYSITITPSSVWATTETETYEEFST